MLWRSAGIEFHNVESVCSIREAGDMDYEATSDKIASYLDMNLE